MIGTVELEGIIQQITDEVVTTLEQTYPPMYWRDESLYLKDNHVNMLRDLGASRIGIKPGITDISQDLASMIDHTLLKADALPQDVEKLCKEAIQYSFASVCINPCYVKYAKKLLQGSPVKVCTVIGFPLGATTTPVKAYEAQIAELDGAEEVDMVLAVGALKSKAYDYVENDIRAVVEQVNSPTIVKVILETALLTDEEKIMACQLAKKAQANFVKTSTGFGPGGATASDVALMRKIVGSTMGVKASGGIRDRQAAQLMVKSGASRIGASASVKIVSTNDHDMASNSAY